MEQPKIEIRSGGQTGADRGGLDAGLDAGLTIGGWCPRGRKAENGPIPERYPLKETPSSDYPQRTEWNVRDTDGTVIFFFGPELGRGSSLTVKYARKHEKPMCLIDLAQTKEKEAISFLLDFLKSAKIGALNVAGNRESRALGIQEKVRGIILKALADKKSSQ